MNSERLAQLLGETVVNVFEETVYALMDRTHDVTPEDVPMVQSLVSFSGTYHGSLVLEVEAAGVAQLECDFLGADAEASEAGARNEVVGELANIIAGRLLEAWQPEATNYDIGIPQVGLVRHGESRACTEPRVCGIEFRTDASLHVVAAIVMGSWS